MREIKYKVWCKYTKKMREVLSIDFKNKKVYIEANEKGVPFGYIFFDDCELMQSTGLKDKNGVDIYEGYILREDKITGKVIYNKDAFEMEWISKNHFNNNILNVRNENMEVVGNIFEKGEVE